MSGSSTGHCAFCGRRLPDDVDEDGTLIQPYSCTECEEAQDEHYRDGMAS